MKKVILNILIVLLLSLFLIGCSTSPALKNEAEQKAEQIKTFIENNGQTGLAEKVIEEDPSLKITEGGVHLKKGDKVEDSKINDVKTFKLSDLTEGNNYVFDFNLNVDDVDKKYVILFEADSYYVSSLSIDFNVSTFNGERVNIKHNKYSTNIFSNYKNDENMDLNQTFIFSGFREVGDYVLRFVGDFESNRITVTTFWYK